MNIREAILKAADHIEQSPGDFNFMSIYVPGGPGCRACALGWIGYFMGLRPYKTVHLDVAQAIMGTDGTTFYAEMRRLHKDFMWVPGACAFALREYAAAHYPETAVEPRKGIPEMILNLFRDPVSA